MKYFPALFAFLFSTFFLQAQLVVNEVQPQPNAGEPEWVEIFNAGTSAVTLKSGRISDRTSTVSLPDFTLAPKQYAVISRDTSALLETRIIPKNVLLLEIKLPSLNNTTDAVVLRRADSTVIDSLYYNVKWGAKGISLERKNPLLPAQSQTNLSASLAADSATCGYLNSIALTDIDAKAASLTVRNDSLFAMIRNNGLQTISALSCRIYWDKNRNGIAESSELLAQTSVSSLKSADSSAISAEVSGITRGKNSFIVAVNTANDERKQNDTLRSEVFLSYPRRTILINEIMYAPLAGNAEYVELYNTSADTISLLGWKLHDKATSSGADTVKIQTDCKIPPLGFAVVAWDSAFFRQFPALTNAPNIAISPTSLSLNADGDDVVLRDVNGNIADSTRYDTHWHLPAISSTNGRSLEKISANFASEHRDSWTTCGDITGGTPARANSVAVEVRKTGTLSATPNPLSSHDPVCVISYEFPMRQVSISAWIYDAKGVKVRELANNSYSSGSGFLVWNATQENSERVPPGAYIGIVEAVNTENGETSTEKILVVVAP